MMYIVQAFKIALLVTVGLLVVVNAPTVSKIVTGEYKKLNKEMLPGESAIISTVDGSRGCTYRQSDGTEVNGFRWLDYDSDLWMTLDPGDNVLRLTADEGRENLTATVTAPKGVAAGV